jgi:hypothetical protein
MPSDGAISRRAFVAGGIGLAAVGVGAVVARQTRTDTASETEVAVQRPDGLAALGTAYLAAYPDDRQLDGLFTAVPELQGSLSRDDVRAQLPAVARAARQDFTDGDVVVVERWRLGRTEAQAAALLSQLPA